MLVEKVIKSKMVKGKKQLFVKWLGFDSSASSWIPESDIMDVLEEPKQSDLHKYTVTQATPQKIKLKKVKA